MMATVTNFQRDGLLARRYAFTGPIDWEQLDIGNSIVAGCSPPPTPFIG